MTAGAVRDTDVVLRSQELMLRIRPAVGADLVTLLDARTGEPWLLTTPWADLPAVPVEPGDPQGPWLRDFQGGWQVLSPNAGAARSVHGVTWPFHGSASRTPWTLAEADSDSATLTTDLPDAPLRLRRTVTLAGADLVVSTTTTNTGDVDLDVHHVEHVTMGPPLLGPGTTLDSNATRLELDPDAPGPGLAPTSTRWPALTYGDGTAGSVHDLLGEHPAAAYGWLSGYADSTAWVAVTSPDARRTLRLEWDPRVLPHAWLWVENRASTAGPWHGRTQALGIEPADVATRARDRPETVAAAPLPAGATRVVTVTARTRRGRSG